MRLLLDTNSYTDMARGVATVVSRHCMATEIWLPLFALGELRAGFVAGTRRQKNEAALVAFLGKPNTAILLPDETTALYYGDVYLNLRRAGKPIPVNDMWIAALALQHGLTLDSRDAHFDNIPGLLRVS